MFDTKVGLIVRDDLAVWQKLNVIAFIATGVAAALPNALGEPYEDADGREYGRLLIQPIMVFSADIAGLRRAHAQGTARDLTLIPYVYAMFSTGDDAANRAAFLAEDPSALDLVGLAIHGPRKSVDKAVKGLALHT